MNTPAPTPGKPLGATWRTWRLGGEPSVRPTLGRMPKLRPALAALLLAAVAGCDLSPGPEGETVRFTVAQGSGFGAVADTLAQREVIRWPTVFRAYARYLGAERSIKPGVYEVEHGIAWAELLDKMVRGDVVQVRIVVPEGWTIQHIAPRIAEATDTPADSLFIALMGEESAEQFEVPGPNLEGYLYPATYAFAVGTPPAQMIRVMVDRYRQIWTPERVALRDSIGMSERELVTLASIVEREARRWGERDTIAAVFHNRLRINMPLQADPTVQYARGIHATRLLYAHIDEVADHPYNTYGRRGLPPGPIASPSAGAIDATLRPADVNFLYFVARPDGSHIFTRTLAEHNAARRQVAQMRDAAAPAEDR
jgi:UPF0755 protein